MTLEYAVYLCLLIATRLIYLRQDEPFGWPRALTLAVAQGFLLASLFRPDTGLAIVVAAVMALTLAGSGWLERYWSVAGARLLSLAGLMLVPVAVYGPDVGLAFGPLVSASADAGAELGRLFLGQAVEPRNLVLIVLGLLLLANEVNIAIRAIFRLCGLVPQTDQHQPDTRAFNAGRIIGILERWLMFLVVLAANLNALGFIIAAKGLVRFERLKDREFAEYMLVGTLLSALFAIAVAWWVTALRAV